MPIQPRRRSAAWDQAGLLVSLGFVAVVRAAAGFEVVVSGGAVVGGLVRAAVTAR